MKVVAALDSFKGSLSSQEANSAVSEGVLKAIPNAEVITCDIADGGEGTCAIMTREMKGTQIEVDVLGPLGSTRPPIKAQYGFIEDAKTAIIEMASAAGITLLQSNEKNPLKTTTYGVGQMILHALNKGAKNFIITIGGSSTNDCGIGMLTSLGVKFLNKDGKTLEGFGEDLKDIVAIDISGLDKNLQNANFTVMCDVDNPLYGKQGCSYVYAPQKGADLKTVAEMDQWIFCFARLVQEIYKDADPDFPGSGAAGGMGFALKTFLNGKLRPGIEVIIEAIDLQKKLQNADLVITGEGRIDEQSIHGKVIAGVSHIAKNKNIPVIALCGCMQGNLEPLHDQGIKEIINIHPEEDRNLPPDILMSREKSYEDIVNTVINLIHDIE